MLKPLGIVDSGSGGLTIWQSIVSLLPYESIIYVGDHANLPYSQKSTRFIRNRMRVILTRLAAHVKLIILACNTATVAGIAEYRKEFPEVPIIGVVPVIKTASEQSLRRSFVVLSTQYTARSEYQKRLIRSYAPDCTIFNLGCTADLVTFVERGILTGARVRHTLEDTLKRAPWGGYDVIVLGCTHYPFLRLSIRAIVGRNIQILDSGGAVARHVQRILRNNGTLVSQGNPSYEFITSGNAALVSRIAHKLIGREIRFRHVSL